MVSQYPSDRDSFRRYREDVDDMVAADILAMFDALVAIETELGVEPSGEFGSIQSRLSYAIDLENGAWKRLQWTLPRGLQATAFSHTGEGYLVSYDEDRFKGADTAFGSDTPAVFVAPQPVQFDLTTGANAEPWAMALRKVDSDRCWVYAHDAQFGDLANSTRANVQVGVLVWAIRG